LYFDSYSCYGHKELLGTSLIILLNLRDAVCPYDRTDIILSGDNNNHYTNYLVHHHSSSTCKNLFYGILSTI